MGRRNQNSKNTRFLTILILSLTIISCKNDMKKNNENSLKTYLLTNKNNCCIEVLNFGATVMSIEVPDKNGNISNKT